MTEGIFWIGRKAVWFRRKVVWIGRKSGLGAGRSDIFRRTDEEEVDCRREKPMKKIVRIRAENPSDCTGVAETLAVCMGVAETPTD